MSTGKSLAMLPFFVRDYITATRHMTLAERGAYTDLLFSQWETGSLPQDPERLVRILGCTLDEFEKVWATIKVKFAETPDGRIVNQRLEEHRAEALRRRDGKAHGAELTNAKRRAERHGERTHSDTLSGTPPSPSPSPSPSPDRTSPVVPQVGQGRARSPRKLTVKPNDFEQQLIAEYHRLLPDHPRLQDWTRNRRRLLQSRVAECIDRGTQADRIEFWQTFFEHVSDDAHLCGLTGEDNPFVANLAWMLQSENFLKLIERFDLGGRGNVRQPEVQPHA